MLLFPERAAAGPTCASAAGTCFAILPHISLHYVLVELCVYIYIEKECIDTKSPLNLDPVNPELLQNIDSGWGGAGAA